MGFTTGAYEVFKDLDKDGSGTVAYTELSQVLTKELPNNTFAKQLLSTMALACNDARTLLVFFLSRQQLKLMPYNSLNSETPP